MEFEFFAVYERLVIESAGLSEGHSTAQTDTPRKIRRQEHVTIDSPANRSAHISKVTILLIVAPNSNGTRRSG